MTQFIGIETERGFIQLMSRKTCVHSLPTTALFNNIMSLHDQVTHRCS